MRLSLGLMLAFILLPLSLEAKVDLKYDRFKNTTAVLIGPGSGKPRPTLYVVTVVNGKKPAQAPPLVAFNFNSVSPEWSYLKCHSTDLLLDGQALHLNTKHDGSVGSGYVSEYIESEMKFEQFKKVAAAKRIEVKICNTEFLLSASEMADLKKLAVLLTPGNSAWDQMTTASANAAAKVSRTRELFKTLTRGTHVNLTLRDGTTLSGLFSSFDERVDSTFGGTVYISILDERGKEAEFRSLSGNSIVDIKKE